MWLLSDKCWSPNKKLFIRKPCKINYNTNGFYLNKETSLVFTHFGKILGQESQSGENSVSCLRISLLERYLVFQLPWITYCIPGFSVRSETKLDPKHLALKGDLLCFFLNTKKRSLNYTKYVNYIVCKNDISLPKFHILWGVFRMRIGALSLLCKLVIAGHNRWLFVFAPVKLAVHRCTRIQPYILDLESEKVELSAQPARMQHKVCE